MNPHDFHPLTTDPHSLLHMQGQFVCRKCGLVIHTGYPAEKTCPFDSAPENKDLIDRVAKLEELITQHFTLHNRIRVEPNV